MNFLNLHRNIKIRMFVMFAFGTVQATSTPFMAIYFAKNFGESVTGLLLTLSIIAGMLSGLVGGYYADRMGRRKIMIFSEAVFLAAYAAMAIANSAWVDSASLTFVAFLVTNVCWGIYGPVDEAMMLDVTDAVSRPYVYGMFYWMFNLTMAVGASIGALTFEHYRFELFGTMSVVLTGILFTTVFFIKETHHPTQDSRRVSLSIHSLLDMIRNYAVVLRDVTFVRYAVAGILVMAVESQLQNYIGIRLAKQMPMHTLVLSQRWSIHFDGVNMLGFLQTENTVLVVLLAGVAASLARRFSDRWVLLAGLGIMVIGYSLMTGTNSPVLLFVSMFVATIGEVATVPVRQTYLGDIASEDARSSYLAVNAMSFNGSRVLSSLGVLVGAYLPSWGVGILSILVGVAGIWIYQTIVPVVHARRAAIETLGV